MTFSENLGDRMGLLEGLLGLLDAGLAGLEGGGFGGAGDLAGRSDTEGARTKMLEPELGPEALTGV
jgi:hypothetical protein